MKVPQVKNRGDECCRNVNVNVVSKEKVTNATTTVGVLLTLSHFRSNGPALVKILQPP